MKITSKLVAATFALGMVTSVAMANDNNVRDDAVVSTNVVGNVILGDEKNYTSPDHRAVRKWPWK